MGGDAGSLGAPTTIVGDVDGAPYEVMPAIWERPPPLLETWMEGPWEAMPAFWERPPPLS
jgi:hypothetical protein